MGRVGYGPSLSWAEFVMGRDVQLPVHAGGWGLMSEASSFLRLRFSYIVRNHLDFDHRYISKMGWG